MADEKATSALERLSAQAAWAADRKRRMAFWNALLRLRKEFDKERQLDN